VVKIPFKEPFVHSLASRQYAENVIVEIETDKGILGYGECVPREYVTGETIESVISHLSRFWAPLVWGQDWATPVELTLFLKTCGETIFASFGIEEEKMPAARCAFELALLDAAGKSFGCSAAEILGWELTRRPIFYSGVISGGTVKKAAQKAFMMRLYGFKAIKLKVGNDHDLEKIEKVRKKIGPKIDLRLDANGAWESNEAIERIRSFEPYQISAVEQPVAKSNIEGMGQVTREIKADIIADESFSSLREAKFLFEQNGCDILNIRLSKCGGLIHASEIARLARLKGKGIQLGCQVGESAILSSAGRIFAQCHPELRYAEGSYERFLLKEDVSQNRVRFYYRGKGYPIFSPGLGVEIDQKTLDRLTQTYLVLKP